MRDGQEMQHAQVLLRKRKSSDIMRRKLREEADEEREAERTCVDGTRQHARGGTQVDESLRRERQLADELLIRERERADENARQERVQVDGILLEERTERERVAAVLAALVAREGDGRALVAEALAALDVVASSLEDVLVFPWPFDHERRQRAVTGAAAAEEVKRALVRLRGTVGDPG